MGRIESRLKKLEGSTPQAETVDLIMRTFYAPGENGPDECGAMASFVGVNLPDIHKPDGQTTKDFEDQLQAMLTRVRQIKKLPDDAAEPLRLELEAEIAALGEFCRLTSS